MCRQPNIGKVIQIGLGFLILFIGYNSAVNLQSTVMEDCGFGSLGFYNLALISLTSGIFCPFSTYFIKKWGVNKCLVIASITNGLFITSSALAPLKKLHQQDNVHMFYYKEWFVYSMIIASALCAGFGQSIIWTAEGIYISGCCNDENKGLFYSLFWAVFMFSQIIGNIGAAFIIEVLSEQSFFLIMGIIAVSSSVLFATLKHPEKQLRKTARNTLQVDELLVERGQGHGHYDDVQVDSRPTSLQVEELKIADMLKSVFNGLLERRYWIFLPQNLWAGISLSIYSGLLVLMITYTMPNEEVSLQTEYSLLAIAMLGAGEIIGSQIVGKFIDKFQSKKTCILNAFLTLITFILTFVVMIDNHFNVWVFVMTFAWGVSDSAVNTHS